MKAIIILCLLILVCSQTNAKPPLNLKSSGSLYYQEKYFRFLANNYDQIGQGNFWTYFGDEQAIGFKALGDFGSFILVKDWSMYSFKLTKIMFRPYCSYTLEGMPNFDAEMLLVHTIDNGYYPPGRRVNLGINYLVISIPYKVSSDDNPANDKLFTFLNLAEFERQVTSNTIPKRISPIKPIKLHHIIQHQPSYLLESTLPYNGQKALYLIFSQYHYISFSNHKSLSQVFKELVPNNQQLDLYIPVTSTYYRNWENAQEVVPKPTLMAYNSQMFIKISQLLLFLSIALLY